MHFDFLTGVTIIYTISSIISLWGYVPTIIDLWHRNPSANAESYEIWAGTTSSATLYAVYILNDHLIILMSLLNVMACLTIVILRHRLKQKRNIWSFFWRR